MATESRRPARTSVLAVRSAPASRFSRRRDRRRDRGRRRRDRRQGRPGWSRGLRRAKAEALVKKFPPFASPRAVWSRPGSSFNLLQVYSDGELPGEVLDEFIEEEVASDQASRLRRLRLLLDELTSEIPETNAQEARCRARSHGSRRAELIEELLTGDLVDAEKAIPGFDFDSWHVGVIASGADAVGMVGDLARNADRRLLRVRRGKDTVWAWFAGARKLESTQLQLLAAERMPTEGCLAFGEPHHGLSGWRLSHHQAVAGLRVGLCRSDRIVRYGEVPVEASLLHDRVRAASLRQRYLVPLEEERDGGRKSRETLHAYFSRHRNMEAAAFALGIVRQTVSYRLRAIEVRLGSDLYACAHDLEAALALDRLDRGE